MGVLQATSAAKAILSSPADVSFRLNVDSCVNANKKVDEQMQRDWVRFDSHSFPVERGLDAW